MSHLQAVAAKTERSLVNNPAQDLFSELTRRAIAYESLLHPQSAKIVRVISLFYLGQWRLDVFQFAHLYVWQALIMLSNWASVPSLPPTE